MGLSTLFETLEKYRASALVGLREHVAPASAVAFTALVVVGMFHRLTLSTELTDEAFSTALGYRFAMGARPFVDEINSAQTAGLILAPFLWLYLKVTHSTAGIMFFTRLLFLGFRLATGAAVFATIRRHLSWPLALVTSLVGVVFVPHSIPNLGYNVLGSGFMAIGAFVAVRGLGEDRRRWAFFCAGLCNGLATVAYPPLVLTAALLGLIIFVSSKATFRDFIEYSLGGVLVALAVTPFLVAAGSANVRAMLDFGAKLAPRPISKLFDITLAFWAHSPIAVWLVPAIAVGIGALKKRPAWGVWMLPVFVSALALSIPGGLTSQLSLMIYAGLFAPVFLVLLWDDAFCRQLFFMVWIPSFASGFLTAFTSSNGELNGGLGFFPAAILFVVYQALAVDRLARDASANGAPTAPPSVLAQLGPAIFVVSLLARFSFSVYRDGATADLKVRIGSGPYRGLYTTAERAALSSELESIFQKHENPANKLFVYWDLPGAYLFTQMRAAANTVWISQMADPEGVLDYYRAHANGAGIALKLKGSSNNTTSVDRFLEGGQQIDSTPHFVITSEPGR